QPNVLKQVANPLTEFALRQVVIDRTKERDLVSRFAIEYKVGDAGCPPMHQVALPLWTSLGVPRLEGAEDSQGGHLALIWEDPRPDQRASAHRAGGPEAGGARHADGHLHGRAGTGR